MFQATTQGKVKNASLDGLNNAVDEGGMTINDANIDTTKGTTLNNAVDTGAVLSGTDTGKLNTTGIDTGVLNNLAETQAGNLANTAGVDTGTLTASDKGTTASTDNILGENQAGLALSGLKASSDGTSGGTGGVAQAATEGAKIEGNPNGTQSALNTVPAATTAANLTSTASQITPQSQTAKTVNPAATAAQAADTGALDTYQGLAKKKAATTAGTAGALQGLAATAKTLY